MNSQFLTYLQNLTTICCLEIKNNTPKVCFSVQFTANFSLCNIFMNKINMPKWLSRCMLFLFFFLIILVLLLVVSNCFAGKQYHKHFQSCRYGWSVWKVFGNNSEVLSPYLCCVAGKGIFPSKGKYWQGIYWKYNITQYLTFFVTASALEWSLGCIYMPTTKTLKVQ